MSLSRVDRYRDPADGWVPIKALLRRTLEKLPYPVEDLVADLVFGHQGQRIDPTLTVQQRDPVVVAGETAI